MTVVIYIPFKVGDDDLNELNYCKVWTNQPSFLKGCGNLLRYGDRLEMRTDIVRFLGS